MFWLMPYKLQLTTAWIILLTSRCTHNLKLVQFVANPLFGEDFEVVCHKNSMHIPMEFTTASHTTQFLGIQIFLGCWDSAHREKLRQIINWIKKKGHKMYRSDEWQCCALYQCNCCITFRPFTKRDTHTHTVFAVCPSPLPCLWLWTPLTLCPLLQWPRPESLAGWRESWRERGASSLKTTWRCCSFNMKPMRKWSHKSKSRRWCNLHRANCVRMPLTQLPKSQQNLVYPTLMLPHRPFSWTGIVWKYDTVRLAEYLWHTKDMCFGRRADYFLLVVYFVMHVQSCFTVWIRFVAEFTGIFQTQIASHLLSDFQVWWVCINKVLLWSM